MRFHVLACDYDGTLATSGRVGPDVIAGLRRVRQSGRKVLMVTGRELPELLDLLPEIGLFDRVVAENGGLLYNPADGQSRGLADPPPPEFVAHLQGLGVRPISTGQAIVATWEPHEVAVLRTIRELGLELQVIFNKGAVMVLPAGVNKASGLQAALVELGLSRHNVVAIGDAENDHAFLRACGAGVAVANALPALRDRADWTTRGDHGAGVLELIEQLIQDDLRSALRNQTRHRLTLDDSHDDRPVTFCPLQGRILVETDRRQPSSGLAQDILRKLRAQEYQICVVDLDGSWPTDEHDVPLTIEPNAPHEADLDAIRQALAAPDRQVLMRLDGLSLEARRVLVQRLLREFDARRAASGRPHWILLHRADLAWPAAGERAQAVDLPDCLLLTAPGTEMLAPDIRAQMTTTWKGRP